MKTAPTPSNTHHRAQTLLACALFIGLLASLLLVAAPTAALAASQEAPSPLPRDLCSTATPPRGWVVVRVQTDLSQCGRTLNNVWTVEPATAPWMKVCSASPVPATWVIVSFGTDLLTCGYRALNAMAITIPTDPLDICAQSPVPQGWVITAEYRVVDRPGSVTICFGGPDHTSHAPFSLLLQETIAPASGTALRVCHDSPIPDPYQIAQVFVNPNCNLDSGNSHLLVPVPAQAEQAAGAIHR